MTSTASPIVMPKLGLTMSEGTVSEWLVSAGDVVVAGQTLFIVETDKISHEIEAAADGKIISLSIHPGQTVPVGATVATWTGPGQGSDAPETPDAAGRQSPPLEAGQITEPARTQARSIATPLARRLAANAQIDLYSVAPSGNGGRIKARDIQAVIYARAAQVPPAAMLDLPGTPVSTIRRKIAERMVRSNTEMPHFYVAVAADVGRLETLRRELNEGTSSVRLTITHFLVAAIGRAMAARRHLNAVWRDGASVTLHDIAVGVAVETRSGVRMPVIEGADRRSLDELAASIADAAERSKSGRLRQADMAQAAISLSNVGMFGVTSLLPVIDPDQCFIVGAGRAEALFRPAPDGTPLARREITITLVGDHRLVDGAEGAGLLRAIADLIETPMQLLRPALSGSPVSSRS